MTSPDHPRLLLVEDDAVSAAFLSEALRALPAQVVLAGDGAAALRALDAAAFDLWLVDAHLPDGDGIAALSAMRARRPGVVALAHTAARERSVAEALIAAGFAEVLVKPLSADALQAAVRRHLPGATGAGVPLWDDARAERALGGARHVSALRGLFHAELPGVRAEVEAAVRTGDGERLRGLLHRLRASCGFVGAARLEHAVAALHAAPDDPSALRTFLDAVEETLAAFTPVPDQG